MSYYSAIFNTPITEDWIGDYIKPASETVTRHDGKIITRTASLTSIEGKKDSAFRTIIEWPSKDVAIAWMNDPEYVPHLKARL